jgi:hypothetical protein
MNGGLSISDINTLQTGCADSAPDPGYGAGRPHPLRTIGLNRYAVLGEGPTTHLGPVSIRFDRRLCCGTMELLLAANSVSQRGFAMTPLRATHDRRHASAKSRPEYARVLSATGFAVCTPFQQVARSFLAAVSAMPSRPYGVGRDPPQSSRPRSGRLRFVMTQSRRSPTGDTTGLALPVQRRSLARARTGARSSFAAPAKFPLGARDHDPVAVSLPTRGFPPHVRTEYLLRSRPRLHHSKPISGRFVQWLVQSFSGVRITFPLLIIFTRCSH